MQQLYNQTRQQMLSLERVCAYAFDMNNLWVTANIEETDVDDVQKVKM